MLCATECTVVVFFSSFFSIFHIPNLHTQWRKISIYTQERSESSAARFLSSIKYLCVCVCKCSERFMRVCVWCLWLARLSLIVRGCSGCNAARAPLEVHPRHATYPKPDRVVLSCPQGIPPNPCGALLLSGNSCIHHGCRFCALDAMAANDLVLRGPFALSLFLSRAQMISLVARS